MCGNGLMIGLMQNITKIHRRKTLEAQAKVPVDQYAGAVGIMTFGIYRRVCDFALLPM